MYRGDSPWVCLSLSFPAAPKWPEALRISGSSEVERRPAGIPLKAEVLGCKGETWGGLVHLGIVRSGCWIFSLKM